MNHHKAAEPSTGDATRAEQNDHSAGLLLPTERAATFLRISPKGTVFQHGAAIEKQVTSICEQNNGPATLSAAVSSSSDMNHSLVPNIKANPSNRRSKRSKVLGMSGVSAEGAKHAKGSQGDDSPEAIQEGILSIESDLRDYVHISAPQENIQAISNSPVLDVGMAPTNLSELESVPCRGVSGIEKADDYIMVDSMDES